MGAEATDDGWQSKLTRSQEEQETDFQIGRKEEQEIRQYNRSGDDVSESSEL